MSNFKTFLHFFFLIFSELATNAFSFFTISLQPKIPNDRVSMKNTPRMVCGNVVHNNPFFINEIFISSIPFTDAFILRKDRNLC